MTQSVEERELERFPLISRQATHPLLQKVPQVAIYERRLSFLSGPLRLAGHLFPVTIARTAIRLSPPQTVDSSPSRDRYHPTKRLSSLRRVIVRLLPNLKKNFLKHVLSFSALMDHTVDDSF